MIRKKKHWMTKIITGISISMSLFLAGCGVEETGPGVIGNTAINSYFAENDTEEEIVEESIEEPKTEKAIVEESVEEAEDEFSEYIQGLKEELDSTRQDVTFEKTYYAADEEKIKSRDERREIYEYEKYEDEYQWECVYIKHEEGKMLVEYYIPRDESYEGYVCSESNGVMQIDLFDWENELVLKAEFAEIENHYEFTIIECNDGRFDELPYVLRFYKKAPCMIDDYKIGKIHVVDEKECILNLYPSGIYERYVNTKDELWVDYSDMEDDFKQDIKSMEGQIAFIQYTEYTDSFYDHLNAVELDRELIEEYHQEETDECKKIEMWPDYARYNTYFFPYGYDSTRYDFVKTENGVDSKGFLGLKHIKTEDNGEVYLLFYEEDKQEILLGYLIVDIEKSKTYYLNDPECDVMSISFDEILQRSRLVATEYDVADPNEGQTGLHESITIGDDTCEYQSYDDETGYYLNIVWAEYYGMLRYESGYANGEDQVLFEKVMP